MYRSLFFNRIRIKEAKLNQGERAEATFSLTCSKTTLNKIISQLSLEDTYIWKTSLLGGER
jgi:hypothetical protein